mmetsp:Transcript_20228/g.29614  ORF Transcript_20228/g.29614 Transcript_20228/m.29614 type:complete len:169 (+) Transcript_20228:95-601(+)|eukprot:CAMPEP_0197246832 /NCGR_PEP_ID=MMETSP1429-20130617/23493_1 /TAXON_ID=49237 /ORGANISM="Chaetoceros  sp., Strain UNC1202" /LENGTH=168 /DNA_ID=CAMNT_0042707599 /DNA_START=55 /DNA_END=561 /DNA_ORIENTATION=+
MFRVTASKRILSQGSGIVSRAFASAVADATGAPSVMDSIVHLNFVDPSGARREVPGFVGKSIYETCEMNGIELGPASVGGAVEAVRSDTWTEPLYGEGPTTGYDHILLVGKGAETAAPITYKEVAAMQDYWDSDEIFPESRLATQVVLTKEMNGMTVYVPDRLVDDIP